MVRKMCIKTLIAILLIFLLLTINGNIPSFALGDVTSDYVWTDWKPSVSSSGSLFTDKVNNVASIIRGIGIVISVISLSIIGIKFMFGSVEEKANYKQTLIPWLVGAVMVFAITVIPTTIYNVVGTRVYVSGNFLGGYDYAINQAYNVLTRGVSWSIDRTVEELENVFDRMRNTEDADGTYYRGKITAIEDMEDALDGGDGYGYFGNYLEGSKEGRLTSNSVSEIEEAMREAEEYIDGFNAHHDGQYTKLTAKLRRLELAKYYIENQ